MYLLLRYFRKPDDSLIPVFGEKTAAWYTVLAFFAGILIIALIDKMIPSYENPHEIRRVEDVSLNG